MVIFFDRKEAGKNLIPRLEKYRNDPNAVVIGLPRGGVVTAFEIANGLSLPLDVVFPRKVGAPFSHELALGAVTETGEGAFNEDLIEELGVPPRYLQSEIEKEKSIAQKRLDTYRKYCPKIKLEGKTALIVDDGIATGATMKAAIKSVKAEGADYIVMAVPVAPPSTIDEIQDLVDEVVVLDTPPFFQAVGQFYEDFSPTEDEDVIALLKKARAHHEPA